MPAAAEPGDGREVYAAAYFARFAPRNALDMLRQVPGFSIVSQDQGRGLGQANDNVLVDGMRMSGKSDSLFDQLARISSDRIERIEIVDASTLGIPGLSGQVANILTRGADISGRFEYRTTFRPRYAKPSFVGGAISISGATPRLEWTAALTHGSSRDGAGGGEGTVITDALGNVTESRDVLIQSVGEVSRAVGTLAWDGPGSTVANVNLSYRRGFNNFSNDEYRDLVVGTDLFRDLYSRIWGYAYELGGDAEFEFGPGRLKLIGLERFSREERRIDSIFIYDNAAPSTGSRFVQEADSGERIGRGEYRWDMLGGSWQLDAEAAFNRLKQIGQLFALGPDGAFAEIPLPNSSGGVTEDRYEVILSQSRALGPDLTMQLSGGGEFSKLVQTGAGGLTRTFWRPKGSVTLAWTPEPSLDFSLTIARTVGQLAFGDFLGNVNLAQNNQNAGNALLVPQQAWEGDLDIRKDLESWGSATLLFYGRWIDDYIDIIPVGNGLESRGNIDGARLFGISAKATVDLDQVGWKGAKITVSAVVEDSNLADPLTFVGRSFSNHNDHRGEISLRYDVPDSDWAIGGEGTWRHNQPYVRLFETGRDVEGPFFTSAFIEHKDVFGMTVNLNMFNLTGGQGFLERTVFTGLRDRSPIAFVERRRLNLSTIYRISVKGNF